MVLNWSGLRSEPTRRQLLFVTLCPTDCDDCDQSPGSYLMAKLNNFILIIDLESLVLVFHCLSWEIFCCLYLCFPTVPPWAVPPRCPVGGSVIWWCPCRVSLLLSDGGLEWDAVGLVQPQWPGPPHTTSHTLSVPAAPHAAPGPGRLHATAQH